jgi:hypothetical protein
LHESEFACQQNVNKASHLKCITPPLLYGVKYDTITKKDQIVDTNTLETLMNFCPTPQKKTTQRLKDVDAHAQPL